MCIQRNSDSSSKSLYSHFLMNFALILFSSTISGPQKKVSSTLTMPMILFVPIWWQLKILASDLSYSNPSSFMEALSWCYQASPTCFSLQIALQSLCQKDGEQQLQWGQMMAHSPGYPTDNNSQPDRKERFRKKQRGSRHGSLDEEAPRLGKRDLYIRLQ